MAIFLPFIVIGGEVTSYPVSKILELTINSSINPGTLSYIKSGYAQATRDKFNLVLIKLNTPGGLVSSTKKILATIGSSSLPTVIWITPEGASATSAGAIIASGGHLLFMSEGTNIGAATPVEMGKDIASKDMKSKVVNDLTALVTSLSEARGRNGKLFGKMVSEAASYNAREAEKSGIINRIVTSNESLFKSLKGAEVAIRGRVVKLELDAPQITIHPMDLGQRLLNILGDPNTAYILFLAGAALIYLEFQVAGSLIAGSLGTIALILAAIGFQVLPLNLGALGLMLLSMVLLIMEIYITSYGILSLAGLAALLTGSLFLYRTDDVYIEVSRSLVYSTVAAVSLVVMFLGIFLYRDRIKGKKQGRDFFTHLGKECCIISLLEELDNSDYCYVYQVKLKGEIWKAVSNKRVNPGEYCIITGEDKSQMTLTI
jgi:membrane-bound serine protease (ClpP class)